MPGLLQGDTVIITNQSEASQVYNRGYYGYPMKGGGLELDLLEAVYLVESDRLVVELEGKPLTVEELIRIASRHVDGFSTLYIVYRDLRQRGYIVKSYEGDFDFRVYPRGGTPSTATTKYWVQAVSERSACVVRALFEQAESSESTRKELLLAVVDEEGDLTYYKASVVSPSGNLSDLPSLKAEGFLLEDRVLVTDPEMVEELYSKGFYGKRIGKTLQLSLIETAYLMAKGIMRTEYSYSGKNMTLSAFRKRALLIQPDFELRFRAYEDLRKRGLVVKTGFKYGSHFRVYDGDPEAHHSRYLVHAVPWDYATIWPEMSRAVRLAHGVKKDILFARITKRKVDYLRLRRVRP
ncbi:MAG: tRNA-intron lyase [Methanomassiliicoccales archaeon]